jgi:hypothetical protein
MEENRKEQKEKSCDVKFNAKVAVISFLPK